MNIPLLISLQHRPGHGAAVRWLVREDALFEQPPGAGLQCRDLLIIQIRLEQAAYLMNPFQGRAQLVRDRLARKVPDDRPELVLLVEADAVVDQPELAGASLDQHVAALAIGIIDQQIEEYRRAQAFPVLRREAEIVILRIVFDVLLQRAGAVRAVRAQRGIGDEMKTKRLTDQVGGHLAQGQGVLRKIPKRLLPPGWLVHRGKIPAAVVDRDEEGVIASEHELPFELDLAEPEGSLQMFGRWRIDHWMGLLR